MNRHVNEGPLIPSAPSGEVSYLQSSDRSVTGIILAGGRGKRLGGVDKAFIHLKKTPMIERVLEVVKGVCDDIIVVSRTREDYLHYDVRSVEDLVPGAGPLGGLYTGLKASNSSINFIVACDMPFLNGQFIQYMVDRFCSTDILIPRLNGFVEPLHALYSRACIPAIEDALKAGERKLKSFFHKVSVTVVEEHKITPFDPELRMFTNINNSDDMKAAEERMQGDEQPHRYHGRN